MRDAVDGPFFGVCCRIDQADDVLAAGFDYVELPAVSLIDDSVFSKLVASKPPVAATNVFFPGDMCLYTDDWRPHAETVIDRVARLGASVAVIGSGAARRCPTGMDRNDVESRFIDIVAEIQAYAHPLGVVVAPESLRRDETDVWNDLGPLAHALASRDLSYTADSYHVAWEWEVEGQDVTLASSARFPDMPARMVDKVPFAPAHVHIANAPRTVPDPDDPFVCAFVDRLLSLGYAGCVSLECTWTVDELPQALRNLRGLFHVAH